MKIVSLNIRHGGGSRIASLIEYLGNSGADVAVVTEFRENSNAQALREALRKSGFEFFSAATTKDRENSVCIFSRVPYVAKTYPELTEKNLHRVISAHFSELAVYGVYFPQQEAKAPVFDFFLTGAHSRQVEPHLIIGDYNTGLHYIDETGATFHCADKLHAMTAVGYIDCWRSRHPDRKEFTWYSNAGNGFRIDHVFANTIADHRILDVRYDHSPRELSYTDHSALVVEVGS